MSAYGYEIVQTLIIDIEPDQHVKRAMNEINAGEANSMCFKDNFVLRFLISDYQCELQLFYHFSC